MDIRKLIREIVEAEMSRHFEAEVNGYRLRDMLRSGEMDQSVYDDIMNRLHKLQNMDFPMGADIAIKVYESPVTYTSNEPDGKSYGGNVFWLIIRDNLFLSFMNRPSNKRPQKAHYYLTYDYLVGLNKKEIKKFDLNPANHKPKAGKRLLRMLQKMPTINLGGNDWFMDSENDKAYQKGQEMNPVSFEDLLDKAQSEKDFVSLEPFLSETLKAKIHERFNTGNRENHSRGL